MSFGNTVSQMNWIHFSALSTPRQLFIAGKDPVPIVQEAGWAPGPVWAGAENLVSTGTRSPDRPTRSQLVYPLSYRAHFSVSTGSVMAQERRWNGRSLCIVS